MMAFVGWVLTSGSELLSLISYKLQNLAQCRTWLHLDKQ
jgi:hypothetical protein